MTDSRAKYVLTLWVITLAACGSVDDRTKENSAAHALVMKTADLQHRGKEASSLSRTVRTLPRKYIRAFTCDFDETPIIAWEKYHKTVAGRAERASDLKLLSSFGFDRRGLYDDLESMGGKITAPPGLTIFGLPVRFLELKGMIGDANSMYVTTFVKGITVGQVVRAEIESKGLRRVQDAPLWSTYR